MVCVYTNSVIVAAYADNIIVFIRKQSAIDTLTILLERFNALSASKINWNKKEALLFGNWLGERPQHPEGLMWKRGGFKYF